MIVLITRLEDVHGASSEWISQPIEGRQVQDLPQELQELVTLVKPPYDALLFQVVVSQRGHLAQKVSFNRFLSIDLSKLDSSI